MAKKRVDAQPVAQEWSKFKPRVGAVLAKVHEGEPKTVNVEGGTAVIYPGQYLVQAGEVEHSQFVPPKDGKPGGTVVTKVPRVVVMSAEAFLAEYEPA